LFGYTVNSLPVGERKVKENIKGGKNTDQGGQTTKIR